MSTSVASFDLDGGVLNVTSSEAVGAAGIATFTQLAGTHTVGSNLWVGRLGGSPEHSRCLAATCPSSANRCRRLGRGAHVHHRRTATFSGGMQLGVSASGIGSVTLSGGKVVTPSILAGGDGTALFAEQTATCSLIVSGAEIAGQNAVGRITQSEGFQVPHR